MNLNFHILLNHAVFLFPPGQRPLADLFYFSLFLQNGLKMLLSSIRQFNIGLYKEMIYLAPIDFSCMATIKVSLMYDQIIKGTIIKT